VGHETDFTLCDFAADLRAPTPTAAAELATRVTVDDLADYLDDARARITSLTESLLADSRASISSLAAQLRYASPSRRIQSELQRLDDLARRSVSALVHRHELNLAHIDGLSSRLEALNPLAVLKRGYAVVTRKSDGGVVSKVKQVNAGDQIQVRVSDGQLDAEIVNRQS
jgi:exodeoxyribonuclease VII large subunit